MARKKKNGISKRTRFEIFKRDAFTCQYCGRKPPQVVLQCDHVLPLAEGGDDDPLNLVTSCFECNNGKSDRMLTATLPAQKEELLRRIEMAEQLEEFNKFLAEHRQRIDEAVKRLAVYWCDLKCLPDQPKGEWETGEQNQRSIRTFLKSLPECTVQDAMDLAHSRKPVNGLKDSDQVTWKYFCGICWRQIKGDARNEAQDY